MSQTARQCPNCGRLNYGQAEFCQRCGADIRSVDAAFLPWARHNELPPMALTARDDSLFAQSTDPDAPGTGLVWSGLVVLVFGLLLDLNAGVQIVITLAAVGLVITGLWQLRVDYLALTRNGRWLIVLGLLALGVVSWRVIEPETPNPATIISSAREAKPTRAPQVALQDGAMLMNRGGPEHRAINAGPAPTGSLYRSWRLDTGGELYSSPSISNNTLVVGSKSGFLYGVDATTGNQLWSRDIGEYIVRSTPAIDDKSVYINNGYSVLALSLADGSTLWSATVSFTGNTSPTVIDGTVYIAGQNGEIHAFDAITGAERWHSVVDGLIFGSPTIEDNHLYLANDRGIVFAMRADNGMVLWRADAGGGVFAPVISNNDLVYVTTAAGTTEALDSEFGTLTWKYDAGGSSGGSLALSQLVVGSDNGGVSAIDPASGAILWSVATGGDISVGPTISGSLVVVASGQTLYGYDLTSGKQRFAYATGYTIQIPPVVINGLIYVGGRDGYLDAIAGDAPAGS